MCGPRGKSFIPECVSRRNFFFDRRNRMRTLQKFVELARVAGRPLHRSGLFRSLFAVCDDRPCRKRNRSDFRSLSHIHIVQTLKMLASVARKAIRPMAARSAARAFSSADMSAGENVVVPLIAQTLEFTLSSPPPLHQFEEPPLVVETDHLDLSPGKEVEEMLAAQGHEVTDIVGKEKWILNDPAKYEGLIPQNAEWTEFIDEKSGEWVYLDEFGDRVAK